MAKHARKFHSDHQTLLAFVKYAGKPSRKINDI